MSQELRSSVVYLARHSKLLQSENRPVLTRIRKPDDDVTEEIEYSDTYCQLIESLDELMNFENSMPKRVYESNEEVEELINEIANTKLLHRFAFKDGHDQEEKLEYYRQLQHNRRLILESAEITPSVLKSVHQVEGLTSKEANIVHRIKERDRLSEVIIELGNTIESRIEHLHGVKSRYDKIYGESRELVEKLATLSLKNDKSLNENERDKVNHEIRVRSLDKKLKQIKRSNQELAENIQRSVVEYGLDWSEDLYLQEMVLFCGEVQ